LAAQRNGAADISGIIGLIDNADNAEKLFTCITR